MCSSARDYTELYSFHRDIPMLNIGAQPNSNTYWKCQDQADVSRKKESGNTMPNNQPAETTAAEERDALQRA